MNLASKDLRIGVLGVMRLPAPSVVAGLRACRVAITAICGFASGIAGGQDVWESVSSDGRRQVLASSVRQSLPRVTYEFRYSSDPTLVFAVEANCIDRTRRDGPHGRYPLSSKFQDISKYYQGYQEEMDFVCDPRNASSAPEPVAARRESLPVQPRGTVPSPVPVSPSPPVARSLLSSGSGFVVAPLRVVTNHHVVEGCSAVSVSFGDEIFSAKVVASNRTNDLALLRVDALVGTPANLRAAAILGEDVMVAGFPLRGLLGTDIVVTSGQVNSLAGLGNDPTTLQISAPVQPGNSGGPLIDRGAEWLGSCSQS